MRWILFSILLVVIPLLFVVLYRLIVGLKFSYYEYAPDVMTTLVALCCNFLSLCFDDVARINRLLRWVVGIVAGLVAIFAWGVYLIIRIGEISIGEGILRNIFLTTAIIALICSVICTIIQIYTVCCNRRK